MGLRFIHPTGHAAAVPDLKSVLRFGTEGLRIAVCFFLKAGLHLLRPFATALARPSSFIVASIDWPTNLSALAELHQLAPGRVYLHLGWTTPQESGGEATRMHSKVFLAAAGSGFQLWVGSHNLTASALGGANIEAALMYDASTLDQVIVDAEAHLVACRDDAQLFDPARLDEYLQIQAAKKQQQVGIDTTAIVVHVEEQWPIATLPAVVHVRLPTEVYDNIARNGYDVEFFVHPTGTLGQSPHMSPGVRRYSGRIVDENYTELHSGGGSASALPAATHWLEFNHVPTLIEPGTSQVRPLTQIAVRLDRLEVRPDEFIYSAGNRQGKAEIASTPDAVRLESAPDELLPFFTPASRRGEKLIFTPREHVQETARVKVFHRTPIPPRFERNEYWERRGRSPMVRDRRIDRRVELQVTRAEAARALEPFFFKTTYRIASDDDKVD